MLTLRRINADLAESATALTGALAADPDGFERYVVRRSEAGREPWHSRSDTDTAQFASALVREIQSLIPFALHALRIGAIVDPAARLATYEAIDLAHRRAENATPLAAAPPRPMPAAAAL
jgi:hypothetical protein